jgi:hypothetical protein
VALVGSHETLGGSSSSPILLVIPAYNWMTKVSPSLLYMVQYTLVPAYLPFLWALVYFLLIGRQGYLPLFLVCYAVSYWHTFLEILMPLSAHHKLEPYFLWHFVQMIVHLVVFIHCHLLIITGIYPLFISNGTNPIMLLMLELITNLINRLFLTQSLWSGSIIALNICPMDLFLLALSVIPSICGWNDVDISSFVCTLLSPAYSNQSPSCPIGMLRILADSKQIPNKFLAVLEIPNCSSGVQVNSKQNKFLAHSFLVNSK